LFQKNWDIVFRENHESVCNRKRNSPPLPTDPKSHGDHCLSLINRTSCSKLTQTLCSRDNLSTFLFSILFSQSLWTNSPLNCGSHGLYRFSITYRDNWQTCKSGGGRVFEYICPALKKISTTRGLHSARATVSKICSLIFIGRSSNWAGILLLSLCKGAV